MNVNLFDQQQDTEFEVSLFGKLHQDNFSHMIQRIISICSTNHQIINHYELVLNPTITTPIGPARSNDVVLRCRCAYDPKKITKNFRGQRWQIYTLGIPESKPDLHVTLRSVTYAPMSGSPLNFSVSLGYTLQFEVAKEGFIYYYKNYLLIYIYKLFKVGKRYDLTTLYGVDSDIHWIVEVTSIPLQKDEIELATKDLLDIKGYFRGLVELQQVDHLILENKVTYRSTGEVNLS